MRRRRAVRVVAVAVGALMIATMVPVVVPVALADAAPFAVQEARLYAPTQVDEEHFGSSIDIDGDTMVVGVPDYTNVGGATGIGTAHVYVRTGTSWAWQKTLTATSLDAGDKFGTSVAISGDRIVVGAPYDDTAHGMTGSAYVFKRTGTAWSSAVRLPTELDNDGDMIGQGVDIEGDTIVVGCPGADTGRGEIRPIVWNGTSWDSGGGVTLTDPARAANDRLGQCVSVGGDTLLASAGGDDIGTVAAISDVGAVLAFTRVGGAWSFEQKWNAPAPVAGEQFGGPIDLSDSGYLAIVGSPWHDVGAETDKGCAYLYVRSVDGWVLAQTLDNPGANSPDGDNFGSSVALDGGDLVLVGAFWDDSHTGAAYYFRPYNGTWNMVQKIDMTTASPGVALFGDAVALDDGTAAIGATLASAGVGSDLPGAAFVFDSRATITGICRDSITGLPLAGVEVAAYYPDGWGDPEMEQYVTTGADGRYTLSVDSGAFSLGTMGPSGDYQPGWYNEKGLWSESDTVTVWAGTTTTINFTIHRKMAVFRFFNVKFKTHFFTDSIAERDNIIATWPDVYQYEGIAYYTSPLTDRQPLYRFYKPSTASHFYTASLDEANHVLLTWPHIYRYDGPTYSVSPIAVPGKSPVYRFFNLQNGSHFYTASLDEANHVILTWPDVYKFEGPAFWVGQ